MGTVLDLAHVAVQPLVLTLSSSHKCASVAANASRITFSRAAPEGMLGTSRSKLTSLDCTWLHSSVATSVDAPGPLCPSKTP